MTARRSFKDIVQGLATSGGGGGDFWRPEKSGSYRFRLYRSPSGEDKALELFQERAIHFTEAGGRPVPCEGSETVECKICTTSNLLRSSGDKDSKERGNRMRRQINGLFTIVLVDSPSGFKVWEGSEQRIRQLLVCIAKVGGRVGNNYPRKPEEVTEFMAFVEKGIPKACGPNGWDMVLTYDKENSDKKKIYDVDLALKTDDTKVLPFKEEDAPNTTEIIERMAAKAKDGK